MRGCSGSIQDVDRARDENPVGLLGGAFDPVHIGHIRMALDCIEALCLERVDFIPAHTPPHKTGSDVAPHHRQAMLAHALKPYPQLAVNDMELRRGGVSYTIDTLIELRRAQPERSFCFILGADAFASLPTWRRWRELTDFAHLIIIGRRQHREFLWEQPLQRYYTLRRSVSLSALRKTYAVGCIHTAASIVVPDVSSSQVRALLNGKQDAEHLLPPGVQDYIREHNLYS